MFSDVAKSGENQSMKYTSGMGEAGERELTRPRLLPVFHRVLFLHATGASLPGAIAATVGRVLTCPHQIDVHGHMCFPGWKGRRLVFALALFFTSVHSFRENHATLFHQ
jgi:hypothetical protein